MAVLQNMREKFGIAISVIIALSLLYFIAPISDLMTLFGRPQNVGEIAGKAVSYEDFQEQVDKFTTVNEIISGSSVQNEQTQKQIRETAWQEFLTSYMFIKNAKAAGIRVGDVELVQLSSGSNPSPIIAQNPAFADENGAYSPAAVKAFIQNMSDDESGRLRTYWNYLQNSIYQQQYYAKYGSLFNASSVANKLMVDNAVAENNLSADIDYVVARYPFADSTIVVSSSEIKNYYKAHKNFFKQSASRDIEYVVFEVVPSAKDIAATAADMDAIYDEFTTTDNMKAFLLKNSEKSLTNYWYKAGELATVNSDLDAQIFGGAAVTPIIQKGNNFYAAKVMDSKMVPDSVFVKHILFQGARAAELADSVLAITRPANFSDLVAANSADQASMAEGEPGAVGWMTQNVIIPGFESTIFADVNKPYILKSQYGTHIVMVTRRTAPIAKKQVAILEKNTLASKETYNDFYSQANRFAVIADGSYDGYLKAIDSTGVYSHTLNNVAEGTSNYGSIDNAREVTRWIFDQKKAGKSSNIITVNNNYFFITALKGIHKEGYTPVEEAATSIKNRLFSDKLHEKAKADLAEKVAGKTDLEAIAEALGSTVQSSTGVSFGSLNPTVEPALAGAVAAAEEGQVYGPVAGMYGAYFFKVNAHQNGEFFTADDAKNQASQKTQYSTQMILPVMMEIADVKDNRARFF